MAAIISFKVEVDAVSGIPSKNLMPETINFFKNELGVDVKTSDEAVANSKIVEFVEKAMVNANKKAVSKAAHLRKFSLIT
jgi:hypothetical protein